jgi:CRP-like cAMP-binding protein
MPFFHFGRKIEFTKEYSLADIPVFSSLTPFEQKAIEKKARLMEFKRGDVVYDEDTPPDAFYVVISGRFRLYLKGRPGRPEKTLIFFHRGDHFGEVSLLTGKMHSASVEAKRDGVLLRLDKDDFLKLVQEYPSISLFLRK